MSEGDMSREDDMSECPVCHESKHYNCFRGVLCNDCCSDGDRLETIIDVLKTIQETLEAINENIQNLREHLT